MAKQKATTEEPLEKQLWKTADKLRKNIDAAEYKHIVLGLIFLKYISDAFEELYTKLKADEANGADPEDKDEYKAENVFFVPQDARWNYLQSKAKQPEIGKFVDDAMDAIEKENASLKGVLPKVFARQNLDPTSLGELIDLVGNIALGDAKARSADVLGHVFEYFLGEFALAEGKKGGQFYTPRSVVELLVEMLEPYKGRVFDPCCGSGGMFVHSEKFVTEHQGKVNDISIYGQESNQTTWRLAKMNLAIRGIDSSQVKWNNEGSFLNDAHKDVKADYIIANPPFNVSDWGGDLMRTDGRWQYGTPPTGNANFAWMQHFIYHLAPSGQAGVVLAKGALTLPPHRPKKEFQNIFSNASKKNKTPDTQARQKSTRQMTETDDIEMVVTHDRQERQPITAVWRNGGFSASYDSFVVQQTVVLRINICGENPPLRQAANRYVQPMTTTQTTKFTARQKL
jgi:type I restriction enzyme M protein